MTEPRRLGPYRLGDPVGRGGMGSVYRARHIELEVERAVKVMHRVDPRGLARFEREVRSLAQVRHPNVVAIHESGQVDGHPYFAMDLLAGEPLDAHLERGPRPWPEALETAIGVARGIAALHAAGVIHRDIKPQNVVLTSEGRPVVIDLGLAVAPERDERLTKTGAFVGTLTYMAPEQFGAGAVTARSDVYALGLLTFHLVTGAPAIEEQSAAHETVARILTGDLPRPSERDLGLPAQLDAVFAQATARNPAERYPDAAALADALEQLRAVPGPTARERRRVRRAAWLVVALTAAAAAAAILRFRPRPERPEPPRPAVAETAPPAPPRDADAALAALQKARRAPAGRPRVEALERWLEAHPQHPKRAEAERLVRAARTTAPRVRIEPAGVVSHAAWIDDDRIAVAAGKRLSLWHADTGRELARRDLPRRIAALAATSGKLAVADDQGRVGWLETHGDLSFAIQRAAPVSARVNVLAWDPKGERLAAAVETRKVLLLPLPALATEQQLRGHGAELRALAFSPDGRHVYTGCGVSATVALQQASSVDTSVRRFRLDSPQEPEWRHPLSGKPHRILPSPDGARLAVGTSAGMLVLLDADSGRLRRSFHGGTSKGMLGARAAHGGAVRALAFSPDGTRLHSAGETGHDSSGGGLRTWDVRTGRLLRSVAGGRSYFGLDLRRGAALVWTRRVIEVWSLR